MDFMQQQTQKNDDNLRKKDNKINLPAICCALTAVFRLHQHLFHPWAAMNTVHCSISQPYPTPSGQLHHVEKYFQKKQAGTICYTFLTNALKKRICRKKEKSEAVFQVFLQLCGSREATEKRAALSGTRSLSHNPGSSA